MRKCGQTVAFDNNRNEQIGIMGKKKSSVRRQKNEILSKNVGPATICEGGDTVV